jgi:two-component system phosphate regulon sensor histidine kinase PhoR
MSIALSGLILLQAYWLRHDLRMKEQQFGQNVMLAMNAIVGKIEETENQRIIVRHFLSSGDSISTERLNTDSLVQAMANMAAISPSMPASSPLPAPPEVDRVKERLETNIRKLREPVNMQRDMVTVPGTMDSTFDIRIERDIEQKEVYAIQLASEEARFDSIAKETERRMVSRIRKLSTLMQKFTFQISDRSDNIFNRLDTLTLDSIVNAELNHHNVDLPYTYAISRPDQNRMVFVKMGGDTTLIKKSSYHLPLFPGDFVKRNEEFLLSFSGKMNFLLLSMWPLLLSSIVFTLAICIGFGYTISVILKQKKLADIKNDFINNMTHEFKTPIATIAIANESIRDPRVSSISEKLEYYTSVIRDENQRMLRQVENVLQMAQIDKGELVLKKEVIDVVDVLQKAVQSAILTIRQREGHLKLGFSQQPMQVYADGNHLLNVFTNLIDNANKYSPESPQILLDAKIENGFAVITISDQGIGMSKEVQKRIFDTFYRATAGNIHDVKGFGLGLSYVKAILEAHDGTISVLSEPGQGSTFTLTLPLIS